MKHRVRVMAVVLSLGLFHTAQSQPIPAYPRKGWFDFSAPAMADPVLQHAKEVYVQAGCAFCHNVDLHPRGEAADLMHSAIVGADVNGDLIAPLLKNGIPITAKLSPMPQYADLSDSQVAAIVRWIHYARMQGRFVELMKTDGVTGDPVAGKAYYAGACAACHSASEMQIATGRVSAADLKAFVLKPAVLEAKTAFTTAARQDDTRAKGLARHSALLENYTDKEAANLVAYVLTLQRSRSVRPSELSDRRPGKG